MSRFEKSDKAFRLGAKAEDKPIVRLKEGDHALSIIGDCRREMRRQGFDRGWIEDFKTEAMSGDYEHLLTTVREYCFVID